MSNEPGPEREWMEYDFRSKAGKLQVGRFRGADMEASIALFRQIDHTCESIWIYEGGAPIAHYQRTRYGWIERPRKPARDEGGPVEESP